MDKNSINEIIKDYYSLDDTEKIKRGADLAFQNGRKKHAIVLYNKYFKKILENADEKMILAIAEKEDADGEFAKAFVLYSMAMDKNGIDYSSNIFSVIEKYEAIEDVGDLFIDLIARNIWDFFFHDSHDYWTKFTEVDLVININNILQLGYKRKKCKKHPNYVDGYFKEIVQLLSSFSFQYFEKVIQLSGLEQKLRDEISETCRDIIDEKVERRGQYERHSVQVAVCAEFAGFYEEAIELWIHSHYGKIEHLIRIGKKAGMTNKELVEFCSKKGGAPNYGKKYYDKERGMRYALKIANKLEMKADFLLYSIRLSLHIQKLEQNNGVISSERFSKIYEELKEYKKIFRELNIEEQSFLCWKLNALHLYFLPVFFGNHTFLRFLINIELRKLPESELIETYKEELVKLNANNEHFNYACVGGQVRRLECQALKIICKFLWINELGLALGLAKKFNLVHNLISVIASCQLEKSSLFDKIIQFYFKKGNFGETMRLIKEWNRWKNFPDMTDRIIIQYISEKKSFEAIDFIRKHNLESSYTIIVNKKKE
ncbi:MAG: hypothetical protein PF549_04935 [Patescibacteria group bacterium]|jgi:hypothetical protein|nr:hypothetical protein [Patescibacteria group bacterium]